MRVDQTSSDWLIAVMECGTVYMQGEEILSLITTPSCDNILLSERERAGPD